MTRLRGRLPPTEPLVDRGETWPGATIAEFLRGSMTTGIRGGMCEARYCERQGVIQHGHEILQGLKYQPPGRFLYLASKKQLTDSIQCNIRHEQDCDIVGRKATLLQRGSGGHRGQGCTSGVLTYERSTDHTFGGACCDDSGVKYRGRVRVDGHCECGSGVSCFAPNMPHGCLQTCLAFQVGTFPSSVHSISSCSRPNRMQ